MVVKEVIQGEELLRRLPNLLLMSHHVRIILLLVLRWAHAHQREGLRRWHSLVLHRGLLLGEAVLLNKLMHLVLTRKEGTRLLTLGLLLLLEALPEHGWILLECLWRFREEHRGHRFPILGIRDLVFELLVIVVNQKFG